MKLLEGIKVLDLTMVLSGPFATLHLALLGAEVIKIEPPGSGDLARKLGNVPKLNDEQMGTSFLAQNANKKSLTLNLKQKARRIFRTLAQSPDVVVENFRPGVMDRFGLSYNRSLKINPRLVYCAISGSVQSRPGCAMKPAYDQIIQGLSGAMAINGDERLNPLRCGFPACDTVGGLNAAFAITGCFVSSGEDRPGAVHRHSAARFHHAPDGLGRRKST